MHTNYSCAKCVLKREVIVLTSSRIWVHCLFYSKGSCYCRGHSISSLQVPKYKFHVGIKGLIQCRNDMWHETRRKIIYHQNREPSIVLLKSFFTWARNSGHTNSLLITHPSAQGLSKHIMVFHPWGCDIIHASHTSFIN